MQNNNLTKSFSGVIESIRGVMDKDQMWIEIKLDEHKTYFRINKEDYVKIVKLIFIGHLTTIQAYRGHRHWFLVEIDNSFDFCIAQLGESEAFKKYKKKMISMM